MTLSEWSIRRPTAALVLSLLLVIFGLVAFDRLPVRELPLIDSPAMSINTTYDGASPEIVESQITKPLEDQLSGISGIRVVQSSSRKGRSSISIEFMPGVDMLAASGDVRDAVARARRLLPDDAKEPVVTKGRCE